MKRTPTKPAENVPAETPGIVRAALVINLILTSIAVIAPSRFTNLRDDSEAAKAAAAFAVPMALVLTISAGVAIRAYILARRQDRRLRWTAFLPAAVFFLGLAITLGLVYSQAYWNSSSEATMPKFR